MTIKLKKPSSEKHKDIVCLSILFILTLLLVFPAFISQHILGPTDLIKDWLPWKCYLTKNTGFPQNFLLSDQTLQFIPWRVFTAHWIQQGLIPFWNPYQYCGAPFLGNNQSAIFYPLNIISYFLSIRWGLFFLSFSKLFLAGTGMYLFQKERKLLSFAALCSGICMMLGGFLILWLGHPHTNAYSLLPWALFFTERWIQRRNIKYIGFLSLTLGFLLLGGHPETIFLCMGIWLAYGLYQLWITENRKKLLFGGIILAFIFGFLLSSIQWLPFIDYLKDSSTLAYRSNYRIITDFLSCKSLISFLMPDLFGNPVTNDYWVRYEYFFQYNYNEAVSGYIGVIGLLLALLGIVFSDRKKDKIFFGVLLIFSFILAYQLPFISNFLSNLPLISLIHPKRFLLVSNFSLAILAGIGLDTLFRNRVSILKKCNYWGLLYILLALSILLIILSYLTPELLASWGQSIFGNIINPTISSFSQTILHAIQWSLFLLSISLLSILLLNWDGISGFIKQLVIFSVLLVDLLVFSIGYNASSFADYFPSNPLIKFLQSDTRPNRILSLQEWTLFPPNTAMAYQLSDVRGYDAITPKRYEELFRQANVGFWKEKGERTWRNTPDTNGKSLRLLSMMNVQYILFDQPIQDVNLNLVFNYKNLFVYQNSMVLPRAFVVKNLIQMKESEVLNNLATDTSINLTDSIIGELKDGTSESVATINPTKKLATIPLQINYLGPNRIHIKITKPTIGYLFISENYDKGWSVYDGAKWIKPFRANYCFMAIPINENMKDIDYYYSPPSYHLGIFLSIFSLLVIGLIFLLPYIKFTRSIE